MAFWNTVVVCGAKLIGCERMMLNPRLKVLHDRFRGESPKLSAMVHPQEENVPTESPKSRLLQQRIRNKKEGQILVIVLVMSETHQDPLPSYAPLVPSKAGSEVEDLVCTASGHCMSSMPQFESCHDTGSNHWS